MLCSFLKGYIIFATTSRLPFMTFNSLHLYGIVGCECWQIMTCIYESVTCSDSVIAFYIVRLCCVCFLHR